MVLKEALISQLKAKAIGKITIKELCEQADINRSTFYAHFNDVYDLLNQIESELVHDMNQALTSHYPLQIEEVFEMLIKLLDYIKDNKNICLTLLNERDHDGFYGKIQSMAHDFIVRGFLEVNRIEGELAIYLSTYTISGCIHLIESWLKDTANLSSADIATIIMRVAQNGLASFEQANN